MDHPQASLLVWSFVLELLAVGFLAISRMLCLELLDGLVSATGLTFHESLFGVCLLLLLQVWILLAVGFLQQRLLLGSAVCWVRLWGGLV